MERPEIDIAVRTAYERALAKCGECLVTRMITAIMQGGREEDIRALYAFLEKP